MAKIAFIQFITKPMLGLMYLSSILKKNGHKCIMIIGDAGHVIKKLNAEKADMIGFSESINGLQSVLDMAKSIKGKIKVKVPIIVGGPLATFYPEVIENPCIDIICRGEGEDAALNLMDAVENNTDITKIKNLWVKKDGYIFKNDVRPLIEDLDTIDFPDRELYKEYKFVDSDSTARVITSRGCIYSCTNCFQHSNLELYLGKCRHFMRRRTVDNVIAELSMVKEKFKVRQIWFIDDLFPLREEWLISFLDRYRQEIALPFICHARFDLINDEVARAFKRSTYCRHIAFGLETGKERYSMDVLRRNITNAQIKNSVKTLKKYGIKFLTANMICLPGETVEDALLTIKFNTEIRPNFSVCTIYQPLPMTKLAEFAIEKKYFDRKNFSSMSYFSHGDSLLQQKDIKRLVNLHKFFYIAVFFPCSISIIKLLIKLPNNFIYNFLYKIAYFLSYHKKMLGLRGIRLFREAVIGFKYYKDKL